MDSLVGYGSDEDNDSERYCPQPSGAAGGSRRREGDNYETVNMDMSEDSHGEESEPELPPVEPTIEQLSSHSERRGSEDRRERDREHNRDRDRDRSRNEDRRDRRRDSPSRVRTEKDRGERDNRTDRRSPRKDDKYKSERFERNRGHEGSSREPRRGLLGDRPEEKSADTIKMPALMDLKPFGGDAPPGFVKASDTRDAVSPRFTQRDRHDREKERERDRDRHSRRSEERRCSREQGRSEHRSRSRGSSSNRGPSANERRGSPSSSDYRPSSYKVNKKLEVMEKMGLQIKTPDGSMATAQQLRAAAHEPQSVPAYFNPTAVNANRILDQVQKRKLLWSNKNKSEAEEAAKWSGTRFAQDADGKQVSKFMRLMGIKEPAAVKPEQSAAAVDPNKKQEELFQAMQAQYEVARATTHTMRGVGLGFQRGPF